MGTSTALPRSPRSLNPQTKTTSGPKLDTDLGEKRMTATNLATRPKLRGEVARETEQTPKPGRRTHSKPPDRQGRGKRRELYLPTARTALLPARCVPPTLTPSSQAPASKQMAGPTPRLCDCGAVPTVSAVLAALLCVLFALPLKSEPSKSCKPCKIVQNHAPPSYFRGTRPLNLTGPKAERECFIPFGCIGV